MYAFAELLHFIGVALGAFCWRSLDRRSHLVWIAVAGLTSSIAERAMNAASHVGGLIGVASRALNLSYFVGMREIFDCGMAVAAAQSAVNAGRMFRGVNGNTFATGRRHSCLAVASEATFILL